MHYQRPVTSEVCTWHKWSVYRCVWKSQDPVVILMYFIVKHKKKCFPNLKHQVYRCFKIVFFDQITNVHIGPLSTCHFIAAFQRFKMVKAWTSVIHCACHHLKPLCKCLSCILWRWHQSCACIVSLVKCWLQTHECCQAFGTAVCF